VDSNLVTPPDIIKNGLHSVTLVDPEQNELDTIIKFCQHSDKAYNIYVYTPIMNNLDWLAKSVNTSDAIIVNTRSDDYKDLWLLDKTYYYGPKILVENKKRLDDPIHYFAQQLEYDK
jgi:hypothetical protein